MVNDGFRPAHVRNRDIPTLARVLCLMQEIEQLEKLREWQRDRMHCLSQHLSGMPRGGGMPKGIDEGIAALDSIDREHKKKCVEYAKQLREAQKLVARIESANMRTFVTMKYIMDIPEAQIMKKLGWSRRGIERARYCVENAPCMAAVKWQERFIVTT